MHPLRALLPQLPVIVQAKFLVHNHPQYLLILHPHHRRSCRVELQLKIQVLHLLRSQRMCRLNGLRQCQLLLPLCQIRFKTALFTLQLNVLRRMSRYLSSIRRHFIQQVHPLRPLPASLPVSQVAFPAPSHQHNLRSNLVIVLPVSRRVSRALSLLGFQARNHHDFHHHSHLSNH